MPESKWYVSDPQYPLYLPDPRSIVMKYETPLW